MLLTSFHIFWNEGVCAKSLGYQKGKERRASARDVRLVIINGHDAVVRNPGELKRARGTKQDGRLKVVRTKRSASRELFSPSEDEASETFLRLTRAGDFSLYNETMRTLSSRTFIRR